MSAQQAYGKLLAAWRASVVTCRCENLELRAEAGTLTCVVCGTAVRERTQAEASCKLP